MISISYGYRGTTIELSDEFSNLGIPVRTHKLLIDNEIYNDRLEASDTGRTDRKILSGLDEGHTISTLKIQRNAFIVVVGVITGHCIKGTHARSISL